jgi:hypothetical protein
MAETARDLGPACVHFPSSSPSLALSGRPQRGHEPVAPRFPEAVMRQALLCFLFLLAACAGGEDASEPLSGVYVYELFYGRTMEATTSDGKRYLFRFERSNFAQRIGTTAEYVRWHTDPEQGLCLQEYGADLVCGPVYQLNVSHFRWRDLTFSDLTIRQPAFGDRHGIPGR